MLEDAINNNAPRGANKKLREKERKNVQNKIHEHANTFNVFVDTNTSHLYPPVYQKYTSLSQLSINMSV